MQTVLRSCPFRYIPGVPKESSSLFIKPREEIFQSGNSYAFLLYARDITTYSLAYRIISNLEKEVWALTFHVLVGGKTREIWAPSPIIAVIEESLDEQHKKWVVNFIYLDDKQDFYSMSTVPYEQNKFPFPTGHHKSYTGPISSSFDFLFCQYPILFLVICVGFWMPIYRYSYDFLKNAQLQTAQKIEKQRSNFLKTELGTWQNNESAHRNDYPMTWTFGNGLRRTSGGRLMIA